MYRLRLMGGFLLAGPSGAAIPLSGKKNQALLAILALAAGRLVSRSALIGILWADRGEEQARSSLRQAFSALRRVFNDVGELPLVIEEESAAINPARLATDIAELSAGQAVRWGEFLDGLSLGDRAFQDWLLVERQALRRDYVDRLSTLLSQADQGRDPRRSLALAQDILKADPLYEPAHRAIMSAFAALGDRAKALRQFQICKDALAKDLGVAPEGRTLALYDEIAGGSVAPAEAAAPAMPPDAAVDSSKPSIAVLPFANMSGDPGQDFFCDGICESLTTGLARFSDLEVTARHSAFVYKGKSLPVQEVSRALGVRYILEGSVQRSGDQVRITAQLIDGASGTNLWADRYDRRLDDIFAVQDEVTETIVATLATTYGGRLRKAWQKQRAQTSTGTRQLSVFDLFMRALDALDQFDAEGNQRGRELLQQAVDLDPNYAKAHGKLAWTYLLEAIEGWGDDYEGSMAKARAASLKSLALDDGEAWGHWTLGTHHMYSGQHELAWTHYQRAMALNPNDADILMDSGWCLAYAGRAAEGMKMAHKALRLNPHYPEWYLECLIQICFDAHDYAQAIRFGTRLKIIETAVCNIYLAASQAALGEADKATGHVERLLALDPEASLKKWLSPALAPYLNPQDRAHLEKYLRIAGLRN